ncbi:hypothetical protein D3C87_1698210 [compost metagenome]
MTKEEDLNWVYSREQQSPVICRSISFERGGINFEENRRPGINHFVVVSDDPGICIRGISKEYPDL